MTEKNKKLESIKLGKEQLTKQEQEKIEKVLANNYKITSLSEAFSLAELANKLGKIDREKEEKVDIKILKFLKSFIEKAKKNSDPEAIKIAKSFESYISSIISLPEKQNPEIKEISEKIIKEINTLPNYKEVNLEDILVPNEEGKLIPVKISKAIVDKFNINKNHNYFSFESKTGDIPLNFDIKLKREKDKDSNSFMPTYHYKFNLTLNKENGVNTYVRKAGGKNINQIYYSFEKGGKVYLGIIGFSFDTDKGKVYNFKNLVKELPNKAKPLTEKELDKYQGSIYKASIFDSGYTAVKDTIIEGVVNADIGTEEETFDKLSKKYSNKIALSGALKLLGSYILSDKSLIKYFPIGVVDKEGIGTGDITGLLITLDGIKQANLGKKLDDLYKLVESSTISPAEIKYLGKDLANYGDISKLRGKSKLQYISDFDSSGKIGDLQKTLIGEKTVYELMSNLSDDEIDRKIQEIAEIGGLTNNLKGTIFEKYLFWRGLERLNLSSVALQKYLSGEIKDWKEAKKYDIYIQNKYKEKTLKLFFGEDYDKFKEKVDEKINELVNKLPEEFRSNPDILAKLRNSIEYTGASLAYIHQNIKKDIVGGSINYAVDWKIIDNLSLGVVSNNGELILGLGLSKTFSKEFNNSRTNIGLTGTLVNGIIPIASLGVGHDFNKSGLEDWTSSARKINASIGTAFPVMFGSIGYNFGKAEQIKYKEKKLDSFLYDIKTKLSQGEKLSSNNYKDKLEQQIVSSINIIFEKIKNDKKLSKLDKETIFDSIIEGIKKNYRHLLYESNKGIRLSEIGVIFTVIPLLYAKAEHITVDYKVKNSDLGASYENIKGKVENISSVEKFISKLQNWIGKEAVNLENNMLLIDLTKANKGLVIAFGQGVKVKKVGDKIIIGGNVSSIDFSTIKTPGKEAKLIGIGDKVFATDTNKLLTEKFVKIDKDGKVSIEDILEENEYTPGLDKKSLIDREYIRQKEKFKETKLYRLLDEGIDGSIFIGPSYRGIVGEYAKLVKLTKEYNYDEAVNYIRDVMLRRKSPLAKFIYKRLGQGKLDYIRKEIDSIKNSNNLLIKKILVESIISKFFLDEHIKIKHNYDSIKENIEKGFKKLGIKITEKGYVLSDSLKDKLKLKGNFIPLGSELYLEAKLRKLGENKLANEVHKWYTARMSMKEFDTIDWAALTAYNRTAGFLRSVRNELLGGQNTLNGYLAIKGEKGVEKVINQANEILSGNYPDWFKKLDKNIQSKLLAFYSIVKANENYINKPALAEQVNYSSVSVPNIIAFPFTYKIAVKKEHGHVPMYGVVDLVDVNQDGNFDKNDYEKINSKEVNEYLFSMLSDEFKNSLIEIIKKTKGVELSNEQLKTLFVEKKLDIKGRKISLSYDVIFTKWGECFNSTLAIKDLSLDGILLSIDLTNGKVYVKDIYLQNNMLTDIDNYTGAIGYKENKKPKEEPEDTPDEDTEGGGETSGETTQETPDTGTETGTETPDTGTETGTETPDTGTETGTENTFGASETPGEITNPTIPSTSPIGSGTEAADTNVGF